jgi:hypothetical protein
MHTPNNECTSDCRRDGCPEDWAKQVQLQDMGAEQLLNPPRKRLYDIRDNYQGEELNEIERENVESSRNQ